MMEDHQLLARYVNEGSQDAFAQIVERHVKLVYSAALRLVGSTQLAEDVTQTVFANLARKAKSISRRTVLAGWLHRDTRFTALDLLRSEKRRQLREQEALAMNTLGPDPAPEWQQIRPLLDEALDDLKSADRDALLLRFFEQRSLKEIGVITGSGEEAARKRVGRALERLRSWFVRRGVGVSASALSVAITANAVHAAPAGLGGAIATATAAAGISSAGKLTAFKILQTITMTKLKTGIVVAVVAATVATPVILHYEVKLRETNEALQLREAELAGLSEQNVGLRSELAQAKATAPLGQNELSELRRLRGEVAALRNQKLPGGSAAAKGANGSNSAPATDSSEPKGPHVPLKSKDLWANLGNGSPFATFETLYWAAANHDADAFSKTAAWDPEFKAEAEAMFAAAPQAVQERFGSVDGILYAMLASPKMMSSISAIGILSEDLEGDTATLKAEIQRTDGRIGQSSWKVHRFDDGSWRMIFGNNIRTEIRDILARPEIVN